MPQEERPFKKISEKEYEIQIDGRTKTLMIPFGKTEAIFKAFISNGGVIDPVSGQVQTDIVSLITSFREVGNLLLTEYDNETGKVVKEGNCSSLGHTEVITLFQVATEVISSFIVSLSKISPQTQTQNHADEEKSETATTIP